MTSQCDLCAYYWIDEEDGTGECQVNLDEDDLARMLSGSADSCPYFQMYDEYKMTARTSPCCGFSLALSGMNRPEAVWVSASACLTMILSSNGVSEIDTVDLLFLKRNRYLPRRDPLARG